MKELIKRLLFGFHFKKSVRKADEMHRLTTLKYFVIVINGKIHVVAKQDIKRLIRTRYFRKGTRIEHIEARALYTTH